MGIVDLFKPKWKHSDREKRERAVEELTDQTLLTEIAKNDEDARVRTAAVNNPNLTDQILLAEIVKDSVGSDVREAAVEKLADQSLLAGIAKNDEDARVRRAAVNNPRLSDQTLLAEIARTSAAGDVRQAAVERLTDQTLLCKIAEDDKDGRVRAAAVKNSNLTDQILFARIAKYGRDGDLRKAAVERLASQEQQLLADVAMTDPYEGAAKAALAAIVDQALVADVAVNMRQSKNVTGRAVEMLTEPRMLARVVREAEDSSLIGRAVQKIHDEALLLELLTEEWSEASRPMIVAKGSFSDDNLMFIARTYPDRMRQAIGRMTNPKLLAEVALGSGEAGDRLCGVELTDDQAILLGVALNDTDLAVRVAAASRLTDAGLSKEVSEELQSIVNRELGDKQWPGAWRSLKHGARLVSILKSASASSSDCPYYDSGVCRFRVMTELDASFGPEGCSWIGRPHRDCHVWKARPS
jgi:hypothetical protein